MELTTGVFLHEIGQRLQDFSWVRLLDPAIAFFGRTSRLACPLVHYVISALPGGLVDAQELQMFGHLFSKIGGASHPDDSIPTTAADSGSGMGERQGQGTAKGQRQGQQGQITTQASARTWEDQAGDTDQNYDSLNSETLLYQVAKLVLTHEAPLHTLQQDTKLYLYLRPEQEYSVLHMMLQLAPNGEPKWRPNRSRSPCRFERPCFVDYFGNGEFAWRPFTSQYRGTGHGTKAAMGRFPVALAAPSLVSSDSGVGAHGANGVQVHRGVLKIITELEDLITGDTIKTFKSVRKMQETYEASCMQFLIENQIRGPGGCMWTLFLDLIGSAALHLLVARLHRERHPLSGLAQHFQEQLW
ncbi:unnamed protein product [Symbiodinium necroappetens]|uniref:Uncharacterized protein n=1 Tax=Symbiodinium necroappetens TaxID=1628268 RepID=A0A813BND4_9DINO|nr:unnamed protein product [Symbiodinium necroappetens]